MNTFEDRRGFLRAGDPLQNDCEAAIQGVLYRPNIWDGGCEARAQTRGPVLPRMGRTLSIVTASLVGLAIVAAGITSYKVMFTYEPGASPHNPPQTIAALGRIEP